MEVEGSASSFCALLFKVMLIGDHGVGKTSILRQLRSRTFTTSCIATLGADFDNFDMMVDDEPVTLQLWVTFNLMKHF